MDGEDAEWQSITVDVLKYLYVFFSACGLAYGLAAVIIGGCSYTFCMLAPENKFLEFLIKKKLNEGPMQNIGLLAAKSTVCISVASLIIIFLLFGWKKFVVSAPSLIGIMVLAFYRTNKIASAFRDVTEDPATRLGGSKSGILAKVMQALWLDAT